MCVCVCVCVRTHVHVCVLTCTHMPRWARAHTRMSSYVSDCETKGCEFGCERAKKSVCDMCVIEQERECTSCMCESEKESAFGVCVIVQEVSVCGVCVPES